MILRFPYLDEPLYASPPPSLPDDARRRWRPLIPLSVQGPTGRSVVFGRALVDPGADDTILPLDIAELLDVPFYPTTTHSLRWRGQRHLLRYGDVTLELADDEGHVLAWPAIVAFTVAPVRYPLLGICGCLEFLNATFRGAERSTELQPNATFPRLMSA
ncbi:MAG: hypothetical protein NTY19_29500 [Planctomycetota bacterium]|nr:hypothetical protein [Planctomycetota bacterium]